ncbi:MAG: phytoene desaturase [Ignavibacteria bacterium]|nr:phytoene desaturase [Ignavibacteria bacterium]
MRLEPLCCFMLPHTRRSKPMRVAVVGAGIGGLVSAIQLAHAGHTVDVFEQGPRVGGKCNVSEFDGCSFETGPTLLTMPFVLDDVFRRVGRRREDYIKLHRVNPACQYRWSDGSRLDMPFELEDVISAIEGFAPGAGVNARAYLEHAREVYEMTKDVFIFSPFDGFMEFLKPRNLGMLPRLHRLRFASTLHRHNASYFTDKRLLQLFDRFATYNGSNPFKAPATLMVIPWVEIGFGAWYPEGGMYSIVRGLEKLAIECGVNISTECRVRSIEHAGKRATGILLDNDTRVACDHVVSNADVYVTQKHLLGLPVREPRDLSCSGVVIQASVDVQSFGLAHHNIFFADDYEREFRVLENGRHHDSKATMYVSRSCAADGSLAAEGRENWFILMNAPPNGVSAHLDGSAGSHWNGHDEHIVASAVQRLHDFGISPSIREYRIRTPDTMATQWSSFRGALYGASSNSPLSAFLRPRQKSLDLENLWYVGGSAHPGGGIPLVATSGMISADLIIESSSL